MSLYNPYRDLGLRIFLRPVVQVEEKATGKKYLYSSSEYGNLKTPVMSPKDFGLAQAGRMCHNFKNKRK